MENISGDTGNTNREIVSYGKKKSIYADRYLTLGNARALFLKIKEINKNMRYSDGDFIFCDQNGRTSARAIDCLIRKTCNEIGMIEKSAHDIRRTVATTLYLNKVDIDLIRRFMGHADVKTTWKYIVDNRTKKEEHSIIRNALPMLPTVTQLSSNTINE